jgi:hypothetical protein
VVRYPATAGQNSCRATHEITLSVTTHAPHHGLSHHMSDFSMPGAINGHSSGTTPAEPVAATGAGAGAAAVGGGSKEAAGIARTMEGLTAEVVEKTKEQVGRDL